MEGFSASSPHIRILHTLSYFRSEAAGVTDRSESALIRNLSGPFSFCAVFLLVIGRLLQCPTGPLQPLNGDTHPENVVPGKFLRQKCQKNAAHDTTIAIRRELTKSNLFPAQAKELRRPFRFKPDRRRTSPKRESRQAISDRETFTKSYTLNFYSGKTVDRSILRAKTRDSPRTVSTGESPLEKKGPKFFSRDARVLFRGRFSF